MLKLSGEYTVKELAVKEQDWLANKSLRNCRLTEEGVMALGIYRDNGDYVEAPTADTRIYSGDLLILYGRSSALRELDQRQKDLAGEAAHKRAVDEQRRHVAEQEAQEEGRNKKRAAANADAGSPKTNRLSGDDGRQ